MPGRRIDERALIGKELSAAITISSRAFFDDPFFSYLIPHEAMRRSRLPVFIKSVYSHMGPRGRIVTVRNDDDAILGVAAWQTTGGYPPSIALQLRQVPSSLRAFYRRPRSLMTGNRYVAALAHVHRKDPQWYLMVLCADPTVQRSGVGTMLLDHGLQMVDAEGVGSHLETPRLDNVAYYRRFGYELVETVTPVEDGPPFYAMWRAPR
ncbi:MAG TPA: GNAT family N-acetyltransferase [Acidimicrobiales bacterium]|nr:GNAT family N-acetyltransferase [Acidimicrobiales bacterium]